MRVKVQISTGVEVTAACGQFIVRNFVRTTGRLTPLAGAAAAIAN
jgi:hypothetical protein